MMLCTGDFCDRKDTCANYFRNADTSEPCQVESFATFGSGKAYTDANGSHVEERTWCGPNGQYNMYEEKKKSDTVKSTQNLSCKIKLKNFKTMMNAVKGAAESEGVKHGRDVLKFIQLEVTKNSITAIACNGYQLSRYTLLQKNEEEFTCYFKPFYLRSFQWMEDLDVVITLDREKKTTSIKLPATFGSVNYEFTPPTVEYPVEAIKALETAKTNAGTRIAFNPVLLSASSRSFIKGGRSYMEVFTPESSTSPVYCKTNFSEGETLEHILLPVRLAD